MGKQSRKKSSKKGTKEHKEKIKQRRERREQQFLENDFEEAQNGEVEQESSSHLNEETILEGDRVWILSPDPKNFLNDENQDDPDLRRGVVRKLGDDGIAHVQLFASLRIGDESTKLYPIQSLYRDCMHFTTKYQVGDHVVCNTSDGLLPGVITYLWPVWEFINGNCRDGVLFFPMYQVKVNPKERRFLGSDLEPFDICADSEEEGLIRKRTTETRFGIGDRVLINMELAHFPPLFQQNIEQWVQATVSGTDTFGSSKYDYGAYECVVENNGQKVSVYVQKDTDEYITLVTSHPRKRLLDAIEQNCSFEHIDYLIQGFSIDVSMIEALVLNKSIEFGSFPMCRWLEERQNVDLASLPFPEGNTILHEISKSLYAFRFTEEFGEYIFDRNSYSFSLINVDSIGSGERKYPPHLARNDNGKTWLHILRDRGKFDAIDRAIHPWNGLFWRLQYCRNFESLWSDCCHTSDNCVSEDDRIIMFALNCFISDLKIQNQNTHLSMLSNDCEDNCLQKHFMKEFCAKKFIRFTRQWVGFHDACNTFELKRIISDVTKNGFYQTFRRLLDVDKSLLGFIFPIYPSQSSNLFVQEELYKDDAEKAYKQVREVDIVELAIEGNMPTSPYYSENQIEMYIVYLVGLLSSQLVQSRSRDSFSFLKWLDEQKTSFSEVYEYQIATLSDSSTLPGRIKILEILSNQPQVRLPSALEAVKARQCGVLCWMVHNSLVKLKSKASTDKQLLHMPMRTLQPLEFLGNRHHIPDSITTGTFLTFACAEFDSLHVLSWLSKDQHVSLTGSINGFTFLHTCAYFGRLEIILWFYTRPAWNETVMAFSTRKGFEGATAVHVAVIRNHINAAKLLLKLGCPLLDEQGKSPDVYALRSTHDFVQKWGEDMLKPIRLQEDVDKFFKYLGKKKYDAAKRFVKSSACLDLNRWENAGIDHASHSSLPSEETYESIISKCIHGHEKDFVLWLCSFVTKGDRIYQDLFWTPRKHLTYISNHNEYLDLTSVLEFLHQSAADEVLIKLLSHPLLGGIRVKDISLWLPQSTPSYIRNHLLTRLVYNEILSALPSIARKEIKIKDDPVWLECIAKNYVLAAQSVSKQYDQDLEQYFTEYNMFSGESERCVNMNHFFQVHGKHLETKCPRLFSYLHHGKFYIFLAVENYYNFLVWCIDHGEGWTEQMESHIVCIAAYLGHDRIVSFFLHENNSTFHSSHRDLQVSAIIGAAEAGRETYWKRLIMYNEGQPLDPFLHLIDKHLHDLSKAECCNENYVQLFSSHSVVIVFGYLSNFNNAGLRLSYKEMISLLLDDRQYNPLSLLKIARAITICTCDLFDCEALPSFVNLICSTSKGKYLRQDNNAQQVILHLGQDLIFKLSLGLYAHKEERYDILKLWIAETIKWDTDLRLLQYHLQRYSLGTEDKLKDLLQESQQELQLQWDKLDIIKKGQTLSAIKAVFESGNISLEQTDRSGLCLIHLASAYDRIDVLGWLVEDLNVNIWQQDSQGRTPLEVAKASKAASARKWIEERQAMKVLTKFFKRHARKRLASIRQARIYRAAMKIQAIQRGKNARKSFRGILLMRVEESLRFNDIWGANIASISCGMDSTGTLTWSSTRKLNENRTCQLDDLDQIMENSKTLDTASSRVLSCDDVVEESVEIDQTNHKTDYVEDARADLLAMPCRNIITAETKILFTDYVKKWLRQADGKYREFFVRRLKQLREGERSRILAKRLKGSNSTIFETYLEQKSGHRILWRNEENGTILIWFVAKHKNVSRLMQLIDDSEGRSARQRMSLEEALPEAARQNGNNARIDYERHRVLLDPLGNVPLKVFEFDSNSTEDSINDNWSPRLYLTEQERDIIESNGTILLLGRSGTGKTVCMCNRMDLDAVRYQHHNDFKQLFIARSQRLCRYVKETLGYDATDDSFTTFNQLVNNLERSLPNLDSVRDVFLNSQKMDFERFKREIFNRTFNKTARQIDPLLVWTNICTFLKGSIEALQEESHFLGKKAFLNLGVRRCRLDKAHRELVYDIFVRYQKLCSEQNLWDDCDRITSLVLRLRKARANNQQAFQPVHRHKIYVDEIQDYTQVEICIFFLLSGSDDLFLAGDPAQSVVEGVEFRFEDVRSVAYHMSDSKNQDLIPKKPKVVTVNFRSHSGVMDTAAAILRCMFDAFPYSAKELGEDRGLFHGPRPGVFYGVQVDILRRLLSDKLNGAVVLTHDSSVQHWKKELGEYQLVYGIRAAKGLEFKSVIILDFFAELPREFQRPWRNLLLGRTKDNPKPELEGHMKLLYTAVTRCIEQLFFAESIQSSAGDAFVRWLTTTTISPVALGTRQNVDEVEKMAMTQDEWVVNGPDNAEMAESIEETKLEESISLLEKALYCFQQGKDAKLSQKARTHRTALLFRQDFSLQEQNKGSSNCSNRWKC